MLKRITSWPWTLLPVLMLAAGVQAQDTAKSPDASAETAPANESGTIRPRVIRVGAWNIEWLGQPDNRYGEAAGKLQTAEDLADYILAARVDVLALEEICPTNLPDNEEYDPQAHGQLDNAVLREALKIVSDKTKSRWDLRIFPNQYKTESDSQLTAIAWDTGSLTVQGESWPVIEYDKSKRMYWLRSLWATAFSTGEGMTDLVIIPIHMKAFQDAGEARRLEAGQLVEALAQSQGDPDILIIGDSNCYSKDEPAIGIYEAAGFVDLNPRDLPTHHGLIPLDRGFVPADQPEFANRSFQVFDKPYKSRRRLQDTDFHVRYSDHYMIITQVQAGEDDD